MVCALRTTIPSCQTFLSIDDICDDHCVFHKLHTTRVADFSKCSVIIIIFFYSRGVVNFFTFLRSSVFSQLQFSCITLLESTMNFVHPRRVKTRSLSLSLFLLPFSRARGVIPRWRLNSNYTRERAVAKGRIRHNRSIACRRRDNSITRENKCTADIRVHAARRDPFYRARSDNPPIDGAAAKSGCVRYRAALLIRVAWKSSIASRIKYTAASRPRAFARISSELSRRFACA